MQFNRVTFLEVLFLMLVTFGGVLFGGSSTHAASIYSVNPGSTASIDEWWVSKLVTNNCSLWIMVPTNTSTEYSLFLTNKPTCVAIANPVVYTYSWLVGNYGSCSATCGGWSQTRTVVCHRSDDQVVPDVYCNLPKPDASQSCNIQGCASPVSGQCGNVAGTCIVGSVISDNWQTSCNQTRTWMCTGSGGGSDASCSMANTECPCILASDGAVISSGNSYAEWGTSYICDAWVKTPTWSCSGTMEEYGMVGLINHPGENYIWCSISSVQ